MLGLDPSIVYVCGSLLIAGTAVRFVLHDAITVVALYKQLRATMEHDYRRWWEIESFRKPRRKKAQPKRFITKPVRRLEAVKKSEPKGGAGRISGKRA